MQPLLKVVFSLGVIIATLVELARIAEQKLPIIRYPTPKKKIHYYKEEIARLCAIVILVYSLIPLGSEIYHQIISDNNVVYGLCAIGKEYLFTLSLYLIAGHMYFYSEGYRYADPTKTLDEIMSSSTD